MSNLTKIKLACDNHEHKGKPCKRGDIIEVHPTTAENLVKQERAELVKSPGVKVKDE